MRSFRLPLLQSWIAVALLSSLAFGANATRFKGDTVIDGSTSVKGTNNVIAGSLSVGSGVAPNSKAILDLTSSTKGFLPPRMTTTQRDAISSPPTGLVIFNSTTGELNRYNGSAWGAIGGGGGGGGGRFPNLVGLDSVWQATATDDVSAEALVGNWAAYADAAATAPVDMTGGSPNTTCTRTTTGGEILDGAGSFKATITTGASRQGEGCAVPVYIPLGFRGATLTLTFPFVTTGALVEDDFRIFAYDITNSELITPSTKGKLLGPNGTVSVSIPTKTSTAQVRVGIHIARTSTAVAAILWDDVNLSLNEVPSGVAGANSWDCSSDFTYANSGTVVTFKSSCARIGDRMFVSGDFLFAAVPASTFSITIPAKWAVNYSKLVATSANKYIVGTFTRLQNAVATARESVFFDGTITTSVFVSLSSTGTTPTKLNSSSLGAISDGLHYEFNYPVAAWDANLNMAESSQFKISSYLSTGSRVTAAAPTLLGQYRSYLRSGTSVNTTTETNGAPTAVPSVADGMIIYGIAFNSAGTSGQPGRYEIFVGKNKTLQWQFYSAAARTGYLDTTPTQFASTTARGCNKGYDPTTGVAFIDCIGSDGSDTTRYVGFAVATGTSAISQVATGYFDIIVSENAVSVGAQVPRNYWRGNTFNGEGSGSTTVVRFSTTVEEAGTITDDSDNATLGGTWTIVTPGIYIASVYCEGNHGSSDNFSIGITKNSSGLTTNIESITTAQRLCMAGQNGSYGGPTSFSCSSPPVVLVPNDVIRVQSNATAPTNVARCGFGIAQVSN